MEHDKVVIVTGASRGIGAMVCRWLAKVGAKVVLTARDQSLLDSIASDVEKLGGKSHAIALDVSDSFKCSDAIEQTLEIFGRIDALVNNAGILAPISDIANTDPESWRYNIEVNLMGPFFLTRAALPALRQTKGKVINISTGAAVQPIFAWSAYCASKAGLTHFTKVLAQEEPDICSLAVRPGVVDTQMQALIRKKGPNHMPPKLIEYFQGLKEKGGLEDPSITGKAIAWLALNAPVKWSGTFMDYDDPKIGEPAKRYFESPFKRLI
jgi:NAD(P)-dependent dehydrogenase (short-subunit alcohol dehydrogenase family)